MNVEIILGIMGCILLLIFAILALVIAIKTKDGKGVLYFVWLSALLALVIGLTHNNIKQIPLEWTCCNNTINTKYCPDCGKANPVAKETTSEKGTAADNNIIIEKDGTTAVYNEDDIKIIFKTKE